MVIAIGRLKQGPERELADRYRERFDDIGRKLGFRGLEIREITESRARDAATRIADEAAAISAAIPEKSVLVALDERGKPWSTKDLATKLDAWMRVGAPVFLLIGGPDGLSPACTKRAHERWSLSPLTLPHGLAKVIVAEALYRAWSLLEHHPYHRA